MLLGWTDSNNVRHAPVELEEINTYAGNLYDFAKKDPSLFINTIGPSNTNALITAIKIFQ